MTATLDSPRGASRLAPRTVGDPSRRRGATTPATLRSLLAALIAASLAWGALGGWAAIAASSAARAMVATDEPLSLDGKGLYESVADADATITAALLASSHPALASMQRFQGDMAAASADVSRLRAAGGSQAETAALEALAGGLPAYDGDVAYAVSAYALGDTPYGGSSVQVASEEAHLVLLPSAKIVFTQENDALAAASSQATGLPAVIVALLLAIIAGVVLYRAQRWLTRLTNRVFSPGLVLTSVLLAVSAIWLAAGFLAARSNLDGGIAQGSQPAQSLALASIGVQQIRGDAVLNVISRSGSASFQDDFQATMKTIGPVPGAGSGPRPLLTSAAAAQPGTGPGAALAAAAERDATAWYAANAGVYSLGAAASYARERDAVIGAGTGSVSSGYNALTLDIKHAIDADEAGFLSAATRGSGELDPLGPMVIIASLLMAFGCWRGLRRRLAEYR